MSQQEVEKLQDALAKWNQEMVETMRRVGEIIAAAVKSSVEAMRDFRYALDPDYAPFVYQVNTRVQIGGRWYKTIEGKRVWKRVRPGGW
jgi:hypothetical protein